MNTNLLNALKEIVSRYGGVETLSDTRRVKALLADLAAAESKPQKNALTACLEQGFVALLQQVPVRERGAAKSSLAERLNREEGLDMALCADTLDLLEAALLEGVSAKAESEKPEETLYKISINYLQSGPYKMDQLLRMAEDGQITKDHWICPVDASEWELVTTIAELKGQIEAREKMEWTTAEKEEAFAPDTADAVQTEQRNSDAASSLLSSDKNADIIRLISNIERLTKERDQSNDESQKAKESLKKTKSGLYAAIIIGVIGIVISIAVGYSEYSLMESALWSANYSREQLQTELESLVGINVTGIKVGNWGNDSWLTQPGEALYAAQMRYFNPVITYNAVLDGEITFYIKIIQPDGTLSRNSSVSPEGYTFSTTERISRGSNQTLDLSGWGNSDRSTYWAGTWTVEVWFNNGCLRSEKVTINR
jgi:hypothetical protein